ncbi:hypothetical protein K502DRAFT_285258 [Neoconidiobolus thromboides FSU 785]|nr:hypothetical protein K502DRAFT_285258 [Neoconidiobolus thromboides FSU 785]
MVANQILRKTFYHKWLRPEVTPLLAIVSGGLVGTGWYLFRVARNVDTVWDRKNNPYPWQNVDQDTNLKLYSPSKEFKKKYSRDRL